MSKQETSYVFQSQFVKVSGHSDTPKRRHNQDGYLYIPDQGLAFLGDGSSSSDYAWQAMQAGIGSLAHRMWGVWLEPGTYQPVLRDAMRGASVDIGTKAPSSWTTMVMGKFQVDERGDIDAYIASVGDSRAYALHPGQKLKQLTQDHNQLWAATGFSDTEKLEMTARMNAVESQEDYDRLSEAEKHFYDLSYWVTEILGKDGLKYPEKSKYRLKHSRAIQPRIVREKLMKGSKLVMISDGGLVLTTEELEETIANSANPAEAIVKKSMQRMTEKEANGEWHFRSEDDDVASLSVEALGG